MTAATCRPTFSRATPKYVNRSSSRGRTIGAPVHFLTNASTSPGSWGSAFPFCGTAKARWASRTRAFTRRIPESREIRIPTTTTISVRTNRTMTTRGWKLARPKMDIFSGRRPPGLSLPNATTPLSRKPKNVQPHLIVRLPPHNCHSDPSHQFSRSGVHLPPHENRLPELSSLEPVAGGQKRSGRTNLESLILSSG